MEKFGVMLARYQPVHEGHIALIRKGCEQNDKMLLLVGSADKVGVRNPIPLDIRIEMLKGALTDNGLIDKCIITPLNDLSSEEDNSLEWGFYLYTKIVDIIKDSSFTMYYSDGFEIITTWFPGFVLRNYVSLVLLARAKVESGVSATEVRKAILIYDDNDTASCDILKRMIPTSVYERRELIRAFIKLNVK